jgi:hypothetical protein
MLGRIPQESKWKKYKEVNYRPMIKQLKSAARACGAKPGISGNMKTQGGSGPPFGDGRRTVSALPFHYRNRMHLIDGMKCFLSPDGFREKNGRFN